MAEDTKNPPEPKSLPERFLASFQKSAPYIGVVCALAIGALTVQAQRQVKEWARDVVSQEYADNSEFRKKAEGELLEDGTFVAKVDDLASQQVQKATSDKGYWDKIDTEVKTVAKDTAISEVNTEDAERISRLVDAMLNNDDFRLIVVTRLTQDPRLHRELVRGLMLDSVALSTFRGNPGPPGPPGAKGEPGPAAAPCSCVLPGPTAMTPANPQ